MSEAPIATPPSAIQRFLSSEAAGGLTPIVTAAVAIACGIGSWGAPGGAVSENGRLRQGAGGAPIG